MRLMKGGACVHPTPMIWQTGNAIVDEQHFTGEAAADIDYWVTTNVKVAGGGALTSRNGDYLYAPTVYPGYIKYFTEENIHVEHWAHPERSSAIKLARAISILHFNIVYGHWLTEILPKILLLKYCAPHLINIPIILPSTTPEYVVKRIKSTIPGWPLIIYNRFNQHVEVETLILPGSLQTHYNYHPYFATLLDRYVADQTKWRRWVPDTAQVGKQLKIFVSRANISSKFRRLTNADELEAVARSFGFKVIHPEKLSWSRQLDLFSRASIVAGEFGSGMHNTLFSKRNTNVICLNWIVDVQSRIANYRGHKVGYVLPPDGEPRLFTLEGDFHDYTIDPKSFSEALSLAL